ncbi:MAG: zinc ribbon domain-containing protein, partial [Terriglobia bacterium]
MFKTARFKIHNPSRHKATVLWYALTHYHLTLKRVLEAALGLPDLPERITIPDKKGRPRVNRYAISRLLYTLAPKGWALAPLRDYLIGDAAAMLQSHFSKLEKGKNESNPPTVSDLHPYTEAQSDEAYRRFAETIDFPLKPQQEEKIETAREKGQVRVAERLGKIYNSWAAARAAGDVLRSLEAPLPRPIEFTRPEFERGCLLARRGNDFYLLVRLFQKGHRYWKPMVLEEGFVDWRTREAIAGRKYSGLILPLELGREFHEREYLAHGRPQSAKLLARRAEDGNTEFYAHIAFEFTPEPIPTQTFLGIDRGAAKIGAATVIDANGCTVADAIDLEGAAFSAEMARYRARIAEAQRKGSRRKPWFRLRGRRADIAIGEYANRLVAEAVKHRSQIALEKIDARSMARFLTQSQFRKLQTALTYKAERAGLPAPVEVPAARTSQTCARCGHWARENRPKKDAAGRAVQDVFRCIVCGHEANA